MIASSKSRACSPSIVTVTCGTEIGPALEVALLDRRAEPAGLLDRVLAVPGDDAVLSQDDLGVDSGLVDAAEHLDHPSERTARGGRPLGDFDRHHVARRRVLALAGGNLDVHDQPAVERHDEAPARFVDVEPADRIAGAAFEDPDDPAFGAAVGNPLDPGDDAVAVHRLIEVAAGDEDVAGDLLERPVRHDEAEAAGVGGDPADDQVHPVGQAVAVATGLDELPAGDELAEKPLEVARCSRGIFSRCSSSRGVDGWSTLSRISLSSCSWLSILYWGSAPDPGSVARGAPLPHAAPSQTSHARFSLKRALTARRAAAVVARRARLGCDLFIDASFSNRGAWPSLLTM